MGAPELQVSATCVRIPVFVGHGQAIWMETERQIPADEVRQLLL